MKISTEKPAELARRTEKELFALFQGVDSKYKNKYRSLTFNLKDTKNNVSNWDFCLQSNAYMCNPWIHIYVT